MNLPKVKFYYAYPLDRGKRQLFKDRSLGPYPSMDEVKETMKRWEQLWNEANENDKIIKELIELTTKTPERSLECFVFGGGMSSMSTPFLMSTTRKGANFDDETFIETMIHEILHIFVTADADKYWDMIHEKYADEEPVVQNHIPVYAFLESVYDKFFDDRPGDYRRNDLPVGYQRAIDIVKEVGYVVLIKEFKKFAS